MTKSLMIKKILEKDDGGMLVNIGIKYNLDGDDPYDFIKEVEEVYFALTATTLEVREESNGKF